MQIRLEKAAMAEHSSLDFSPNPVHRCLQQRASMPEGPADPSVNRADFRISSAVMVSKRTGWNPVHQSSSNPVHQSSPVIQSTTQSGD